jgi:ADP-ribose pyrophosphatase
MSEDKAVVVHERKRVFDGFFKIDQAVVSYPRVNGDGRMERVTRLCFERGDSAAALVHDVERDVLILAKQFRYPTFGKSDGFPIEIRAGMIEAGESPEACIRREAMQEIGYELKDVRKIAEFFVSPGGTSERIFLFYAPVTSADFVDPTASGVEDEQEDVLRIDMDRKEFLRRCDVCEIVDAKTLLAGLWLKANV